MIYLIKELKFLVNLILSDFSKEKLYIKSKINNVVKTYFGSIQKLSFEINNLLDHKNIYIWYLMKIP